MDSVTSGEEQNSIVEFVPAVSDCTDRHSTKSREIFRVHVVHLHVIDEDKLEQIRLNTAGQAESHMLFLERNSRITAFNA